MGRLGFCMLISVLFSIILIKLSYLSHWSLVPTHHVFKYFCIFYLLYSFLCCFFKTKNNLFSFAFFVKMFSFRSFSGRKVRPAETEKRLPPTSPQSTIYENIFLVCLFVEKSLFYLLFPFNTTLASDCSSSFLFLLLPSCSFFLGFPTRPFALADLRYV